MPYIIVAESNRCLVCGEDYRWRAIVRDIGDGASDSEVEDSIIVNETCESCYEWAWGTD